MRECVEGHNKRSAVSEVLEKKKARPLIISINAFIHLVTKDNSGSKIK